MIGQIIQSYLVSLGVQIDKPGFQQADTTIKRTGENIDRVTAGMARNFVKASTIISSAIASVTASAVGLMKATANEDLAMQKYARSMMMSEEAAWNMKKATDALGESINDIALTPELMSRFNQLSQDGSKMMVGGDFKETMKNFRDLMFEFTRLKQEASYALNWIGYYLMKYLQKPLADIREKFKTFNDMVIKNMSVWTEKVARAIYYVIEVGRHLLEFIVNIGKHVKALWDSFPAGVKKAIAAITALQVALSAGPLGRAIMLISTLLLLIDDYYGYAEGKDALLGRYWDKLNNFLDTAKQKYAELKAIVEPYWDKLVGYVQQAKQWFDELRKSIDDWASSTGAEMLQELVAECKDWWQILTDLYDVIETSVKNTWKTFMDELEKNDTIKDVRQALERLWNVFKLLYNAVKSTIKFLIDLWRELEKTEELKEFRESIADVVDGVVELFGAIVELVETALKGLFGEFGKTDKVYSFRDALRTVFKILSSIFKAVNWVIRGLTDLFKLVARNKTFKAFWESVGKAIDNVISKIGRFSRAMLAFLHGDVAKAKRILDGGDDWQRHGTRELSEREKKLEPLIQAAAKKYDIDPNWLRAVGKAESNLDHYDENGNVKTSSAGAVGMFQLMPDTAKGLGVDPYDLQQNIEGGAKYLRQMLDTFGDIKLATAAYNAGPGAVKDAGNQIPNFKETQAYVPRVLGYMKDYESDEVIGEKDGGDVDNNIGIDPRGGKVRVWSSVEHYNAGWDSKVTNTRELNPRTKEAINALSLVLENGLTITGGAEKGYHDDSLLEGHHNGYKFDLSFDEIPPGSAAENTLRRIVENVYGGKVVQEGNPPHWDCYIPDGGSMYESVKQMMGIGNQSQSSESSVSDTPWEESPRPDVPAESYDVPKEEESKSLPEIGNDAYDVFIRPNVPDVVNDTVDAAYEGIEAVKKKGKEIAGNIWDAITGAATSNFVDTRTAAALGDQPNIENNTKALGEVRDVLAKLQKNPQYKEYKDYFISLQETIGDILSPDNMDAGSIPDTQTGNRAESQAPEETDGIRVYLKQIVSVLQSIDKGILQGANIELPELQLPEVKPEGNSKKEAGENFGSYFNQILDMLLSIRKVMPGTPDIELPELKLPEVKPEGNSKKEAGENLGDYFNQMLDRLLMIQKAMPSIPEIDFPQLEIPALSLDNNPFGALLTEFKKIGEKFADSNMFDGIDVVGMMEKGMQAIQPMAQNEYRDYTGNTTVTTNNSPSIKVDVGGVTINGAGKTNSDVGKEVGSAVMQAASRFFADNCLLSGSRPTKTAIEQYSN